MPSTASTMGSSIDVNNPGAIAAASFLSAIGALVFNIMPLFLGSMVESLGFNEQQAGFIASAYLGGFTLTSFSAVFWSRRVSWHKVVLAAAVVAVASYGICLMSGAFTAILILMACVGLAKGGFFAIALCSLGDTKVPDRSFGLAVLAQVCMGGLGLFALSAVTQHWGVKGILVGLISVTVLVVCLLRWMPTHGLKEETSVQAGSAGRKFPVFVGLGGMLLLMAGMGGSWAFLERIGAVGGLSANSIGNVLSASLFAGAAAALMVAWLSDRMGRAIPIFIGTGIMLAGIICLAGQASLIVFASAAIMLMGGWTFAYPYQMAAISMADSSGRFVALIAAAQGIGAALGPGLAGSMAAGGSYTGVYIMSAVCVVVSLVMFQWLVFNTNVGAKFNKLVKSQNS